MIIVAETPAEGRERTGCEIEGLGDRTAITSVKIRFGCDCVECHPLMSDLFGPIPEVPSVNSNLVASVCETGSNLVDAFLCATTNKRVYHVRYKRYPHQPSRELDAVI
jgi:hypothetical protein